MLSTQTEAPLRYADIELWPDGRTLRGGVPVALSPTERALLAAFIRQAGKALTRRQLLAQVWGTAGGLRTRTVDIHVNHLRRKLGPSLRLVTVFGVGYRLEREA